jgi:hypothetical protein
VNPLSFIPTGWLLPGVAVAVAALLGLAGLQTVRLANVKTELATTKAGYANERTKAAEALAAKEAEYRELEHKQATQLQEIGNDAQRKIDDARGAAAAAARASRSLRDAFAAAGAACSQATPGAAAASAGPAASAPTDLRADVFGRLDEATSQLASYADNAAIAGEACERAYDSLMPR